MATIYIRDESGKEILTNQLKIGDARIITPDMQQETNTEENLNNIEDIDLNSAPGMLLSSSVINAVSQYLEVSIQSLIADNTSELLNQLGINQDSMKLTEHILSLIDSAVFKINSILKLVPTNIRMIPDKGSVLSSLCTSLKDMYEAIWLDIQNQYYETINDSITNLPSTQEALAQSLKALQALIENFINDQCIKYTGLTLVELRYKCQDIIAIYEEYKRKKELERKGILEVTETSYELNTEEIKKELLVQLTICSDLLFNAFMILEIKESVENIMMLVNEFNNVSLESLVEGINTFQDFMDLLVELGLDDKSNVITLKEALEQGFHQIKNNFEALASQLTAQLVSSGLQIYSTAEKNVSTNQKTTQIQYYSFDFDLETNSIIIIFYVEPTTKFIIKNLTSILRESKNNDNEKIFTANDIQKILNAVNIGVMQKKNQELQLNSCNIKIIYELEGYNKKEEKTNVNINQTSDNKPPYTVAQEAAIKTFQRLQEIKEQQKTEDLNNYKEYQLGIVTEEFTSDPDYKVKRPTLQLVHELYSILTEIFPLLKIITTLVSNYKINKAKVENNSQGNLFGMIRFLAKVNNLMNKVVKTDKNFYTVRTLRTYDYINLKIKKYDSSNCELPLNIDETKQLYTYLKDNNLDTTEINTEQETILYMDLESITEQQNELNDNINTASQFFGEDVSLFITYPDSTYKDGTLLGLDKVMDGGNEIYYSNSSLPVIGSQILRAYQKNLDVSI